MKNCFNEFSKKTLKLHLLNKFIYKNSKKVPYLKKIVLNYSIHQNELTNLKILARHALALETLSAQKSNITTYRTTNSHFKIKKHYPAGVKASISKKKTSDFTLKLINDIFLRYNDSPTLTSKKCQKTGLTFRIITNAHFTEIGNNFTLFQKLQSLNIVYLISSTHKLETIFLLKFYKLPLIK